MNPTLELALVCTLLITTAAFVVRHSKLTVQVATLALAVACCIPIAEKWAADLRARRVATQLDAYRPRDLTRTQSSPYAGSRQCQSCHPSEYATWADSYHRTMTQAVTPDTVLADFDDVTLTYEGRTYRAFRDADRFYVDMPAIGTKGEAPEDRVVRPIVMSTGSHHQQLYWYPLAQADEAPDVAGESLYANRCAACHGEDGMAGDAPYLTGRELLDGDIRKALEGPTHRELVEPALSDAELAQMVRFVRRMQLVDRLMQFPFSWIIHDGRWVHEDQTFLGPPYDVSVTEPYDQGWSNACDNCHAVGARFEAPDVGRLGRAGVVELGISCEVCHGPGQEHVRRHRSPVARFAAHTVAPPDDIVNPARLPPRESAAVCGQCHAETVDRENRPVDRFKPGKRLEAYVHPIQLQPPPYPEWLQGAIAGEADLLESAFWGDGTIRIAGRDYNGLRETACHTEGELTCITCHTMHGSEANDQLRPEAKTDEVCTKCHASIGEDVSAHTHHPPASPGSRCYNCHMPHTTWGLLGAMRAHRITSPSASVSLDTGRPNACNLCHLDRPLDAVAQTLSDWYGHPPPSGPQPEALHMPSDVSAAAVWLLRGNGVQRAVAAWHLGWQTAVDTSDAWWAPALLARALDDPYAAVRYVAWRSLRHHDGYTDFAYDFATDPETQRAAREAALARFEKPPDKTAPTALFFERGPDLGRLGALEVLRDTRPVSVNE